MNKKVLLICGIALLVLILSLVIGLRIHNNKKNQVVLDSEYPITYQMNKNGSMTLKLDGKKTKKLQWSVAIEDESVVDLVQKGSESGGKAKFVITPKAEGLTSIVFKRSSEVSGYSYDAVSIRVPIYVANSNGKLAINMLENPKVSIGGVPFAEDSSYPFLLGTNADGEPELVFINGQSDWSITDPNNYVTTESAPAEGNAVHLNLVKTDPKVGIIKETTISVTSSSMGVTEELDVLIDVEGNMTVKKSE